MTRHAFVAVGLAALAIGTCGPTLQAADRQVAWVFVSNDGAAEREVNALAARGLRFAAVTDGLPCAAVIMQATERPATGEVSYRVVADRDLADALPGLADAGYEPRGMLRPLGARTSTVWERASRPRAERVSEWRIAEFANPDTLEADLGPLVGEGFRPRLLARVAFRSWPGLSEKGMVLLGRRPQAAPRELRVVRGATRNVDSVARDVAALSSEGWDLDIVFTTSRDGSRDARRERAYFVFSREQGARAGATPLRVERSSSWGAAGSGEPIATSLFWNDFLFVYRPADRRRTWASPTRLSGYEANCAGLALKLRLEGEDDQRSDVVGAVARPLATGDDFELIVVLDERLGG